MVESFLFRDAQDGPRTLPGASRCANIAALA
jgi:hypothetical protein